MGVISVIAGLPLLSIWVLGVDSFAGFPLSSFTLTITLSLFRRVTSHFELASLRPLSQSLHFATPLALRQSVLHSFILQHSLEMPVLYSHPEGRANPDKTLSVTDYIELEATGKLDPEIAKLGFYAYHSDKEVLLEIAKIDVQEYKERVKYYLESPNLLYYTTVVILAPTIAARGLRNRILNMANRRPSVLVNGLPSVQEDGTTPYNVPATVPSTDPTSTISPQRGIAKMNMLRRMRPPPFQHAWTFYHDKHSDDSNYEGRLTVLLENIITIKPFWEAYNSFPLHALKFKDSVHFFKRGVKPVWEDPRNVKGGTWTFRVSKDKYEETWKEILLLAVGEEFSDVIQPSKFILTS